MDYLSCLLRIYIYIYSLSVLVVGGPSESVSLYELTMMTYYDT